MNDNLQRNFLDSVTYCAGEDPLVAVSKYWRMSLDFSKYWRRPFDMSQVLEETLFLVFPGFTDSTNLTSSISTCEVAVYHSGDADDSSLVGCYVVWTRKHSSLEIKAA